MPNDHYENKIKVNLINSSYKKSLKAIHFYCLLKENKNKN